MSNIKKAVSYVLIAIVLIFTVIAILGIWNIIDLEQVMIKVLYSLLVVFAASAVILFIFSVLIKDDTQNQE